MANIATSAFPFDNADSDESQWTRLFRELIDSGIADSPTGTGFKVVTASGFNFTVKAGIAAVRGFMGVLAADNSTLSLASPPASNSRIDRIVLRLDPTANTITVEILQGTASATPVAPALTQTDTGTYEISLATIAVHAGDSAIGTIVDERQYAGQRVSAWSTAQRPTDRVGFPLRTGKLGYNVSTQAWEYWDGSAWQNLIPTTVNNATNWAGHPLVISTTQAGAGTPDNGKIWLQPTS
jgi:hypothetical protein